MEAKQPLGIHGSHFGGPAPAEDPFSLSGQWTETRRVASRSCSCPPWNVVDINSGRGNRNSPPGASCRGSPVSLPPRRLMDPCRVSVYPSDHKETRPLQSGSSGSIRNDQQKYCSEGLFHPPTHEIRPSCPFQRNLRFPPVNLLLVR